MPIPHSQRFLALSLLLLLAGCGSSITPILPATPAFADPTGNWIFGFATMNPPGLFVENALSGSLQNAAGSISGTIAMNGFSPAGCSGLAPSALFQVTGTLLKTGSMALTFPIAQGVAAIQLSLTPLSNTATGTLQIVGG